MTRPRTQELKEAFLRLAETDPAEREGLLATRHGGDPELWRAVESMLHTSRQLPDGFLEPPPEVAEAARRAREWSGQLRPDGSRDHGGPSASRVDAGVPGQRIGRYELVRALGEGGFGVVWEAEQREPMHRLIALKLIKRGMDTEQVIARFAAEQQALALMDHPGIARVLDAGSAEDGRPYFVMDLVVGTPIVQFCHERALPTAERLRLFEAACRAIHHAHQRGVVHRDIKPSNLLVTECDGETRPKIVDFGIAKAVGAAAAPSSRVTQQRQLVGKPAYMAPEQTASDAGDVDARSDIYSLGVLLYELLTGTTPFDGGDTTTAKFETIARRIREEPPQKPSRRLPRYERLAKDLVGIPQTGLAQHASTFAPFDLLDRMAPRHDLTFDAQAVVEVARVRAVLEAHPLGLGQLVFAEQEWRHAEWEYAARAGSSTTWFFGDRALELHRFANFADISSKRVVMRVSNLDDGQPFTAPVGGYGANGFGLHDVYGNVSEWCSDLFRPSYKLSAPLQEPLRTDHSRDTRRHAVRGGDWASMPNETRSAHRDFARGTTIISGLGLRPAREIQRR